MDGLGFEPWQLWIAFGLILAGLEIVAPGIFLIFIGAAALATGMAAFMYGLGLGGQLIAFTVFTILALIAGRALYRGNPVESSDPLLNDRAGRLIGTSVTVIEPVSAQAGRVKVGDSVWPARGPALAKGETARIVAVENGVLMLQAPALPGGDAETPLKD